MTLEELRNVNPEDLSLAVISKNLNWEESDKVKIVLEEYPDGITARELLKECVRMALEESKEPCTEERKAEVEAEIKAQMGPMLAEAYYTVLLSTNEGYVDLAEMQAMDPEFEIKVQVPISEYCCQEGDYFFGENDEEGPYIIVKKEPMEKFAKDYEEGKFD